MSESISNQKENIETNSGDQRIFTHAKVTQTITHSVCTESGKAGSTKISRHTRVSTWGFAGANKPLEMQSLHLTGVNRAGVISTWGLRAPDAYFLAIVELQERGVFGFNDIDIMPTDNGSAQRVLNTNSFIENLNTGPMQDDVDNQGEKCTPCKCANSRIQATAQDALENHSSTQGIGNDCSYHGSTGSEEFTIVHRSILSRKAEVLHV